MRVRELSCFQWAMGTYCFATGALMLVAPHQVDGPPARHFAASLLQMWGPLLLGVGSVFFLIATLTTPRKLSVLAHFIAATVLCALGVEFLSIDRTINGIQNLMLGTAAVAGVLFLLRKRHRRSAFDLYSFMIGLTCVLTGAVLLSGPSSNENAGIKAAAVFLLLSSGFLLWLHIIQFWYGARKGIIWTAHIAGGAGMLLCVALYFLPRQFWTSVIFFGGSGLYIATLPWLRPHLLRLKSSSLRTRLALLLSLTVALPMVITVALICSREEHLVRQSELKHQESLAVALAQGVNEYLERHQAALMVLSRHPAIQLHSEQETLQALRDHDHAFADVFTFSLYDSEGRSIYRSDNRPARSSIRGMHLFELAKTSATLSSYVGRVPEYAAPVMEFAAPVFDDQRKFMGVVTTTLPTADLAEHLHQQKIIGAGNVLLVDQIGRAIAHFDPEAMKALTDLSNKVSVVKAWDQEKISGSFSATEEGVVKLAGYARIPELDWMILVEQPESVALAGVHSGRDLAFIVLVAFLVLTTTGGAILSRRVNAPLTALSQAADEFAAGNHHASLPVSHITEISDLAIAFKIMRDRVIARTAERERAREALEKANEELEATVHARTLQLQEANQRLQAELLERERIDQALRTSEARFRGIFDSNAVPMAFWHLDGRVTEANDAYLDLCGFTRQQMEEGQLTWDTVTSVDSDPRRPQRPGSTYEKNYVRPDGVCVPIVIGGSFLPGSTDEGVVFALDLTERKQMENALEQKALEAELERRRLRAVLEILPVAVYLADASGRIILNNNAASEIWGGPVVESTLEEYGNDFMAWWAETGKPLRAEDWGLHRAIVKGETSMAEEIQIQTCDGVRKIILNYAVPIRDSHEGIIGAVAVNVDITHLKEMVRQIQALNETLEQRVAERTAEVEQRSEQLRSLAAELTVAEQRERRRLAQILHDHLQQLLVAGKFDLARTSRFLENHPKALEALQHAGELIDQSLAVSRSLTLEISPPVLYEAGLGKALEWLAGHFSQTHSIHVQHEIDPDIEPESEELSVFLFQAARELLFNIVKHAQAASATIRLASDGDGRLRMSVEDQGQGFDPELVRQKPASEHFGLFSVRERLLYFGGSMEVDAAPGKGARIHLIAQRSFMPHPIRRISMLADISAHHAMTPGSLTQSDCVRILLVDDHRIFRQGVAGMLADQPDLEVVGEAADGQVAIELARRLQPDVIIMDVSLPNISGIEATRAIHQENRNIRIVGLSMYREDSIRNAMTDAGAVEYLPKDSPADLLIQTIRQVAKD